MAITATIVDYNPGPRNQQVFLQLSFSGSYATGGDSLNLASGVLNPSGIEVEGFFEQPLTLGPSVYLEDLKGYYLSPVVTGVTNLANYKLQVFLPGGSEYAAGAYAAPLTTGTAILVMQRRAV